MGEYIVRMSQVSVHHQERRNILNIPEFAVCPGELVAILSRLMVLVKVPY